MIFEYWGVVYCDHCEAKNFVSVGDMNDPTGNDAEVMLCWECGKKTCIVDEDYLLEEDYNTVEEFVAQGYCVDGKKSPLEED